MIALAYWWNHSFSAWLLTLMNVFAVKKITVHGKWKPGFCIIRCDRPINTFQINYPSASQHFWPDADSLLRQTGPHTPPHVSKLQLNQGCLQKKDYASIATSERAKLLTVENQDPNINIIQAQHCLKNHLILCGFYSLTHSSDQHVEEKDRHHQHHREEKYSCGFRKLTQLKVFIL